MLGIRKAPCWTGRERLVGRVGRRDLVEGLDSSQTKERRPEEGRERTERGKSGDFAWKGLRKGERSSNVSTRDSGEP